MTGYTRRSLAVAAVLGSGLSAALAAGPLPGAPPIKPGLWQVTMETQDAKGNSADPLARAAAAMKDLPPAAREQMEAMMKARGVSMDGAGGGTKVCLSKESFDQGKWQGMSKDCVVNYSTATGASWKWHSTCPTMKSESDGEAIFTSPESYTIKMRMVSKMTGVEHTTNMTQSAKWLGADCGEVKPVSPDSFKADRQGRVPQRPNMQ